MPASDPSTIQTLTNFALSMGVGVAIGTERDISNRYSNKNVGLRDFSLVAILAFVSSLYHDTVPYAWILTFVMVAVFSLVTFIMSNAPTRSGPSGITTQLALPLVFLVASLPNFNVSFWLIATIVFVLLLLLALKKPVHDFLQTVDKREITDFAILIAIAISITPLIPAGARLPVPLLDFTGADPNLIYKHVNIAALWKVVVMVSLMSFVAHFITKYAKGKNALLLATFFGGLVSSLATIMMVLGRDKSQNPGTDAQSAGLSRQEIFLGFVAANTGSLVKDIAVLRTFIGGDHFMVFLLPLVSALVLFSCLTAYVFVTQREAREISISERPLPLGFIFKFSGVIAALLVVMTMVTFYLGTGAVVPVAFLSGIVSSAAAIVSVGAATIQENGAGMWTEGLGIIAAISGSIAAKYVVIAKRLGLRQSLPFLVPVIALVVVTTTTLWISLDSPHD